MQAGGDMPEEEGGGEWSRAEQNFIDQFTRKSLVEWAQACISGESIPEAWLEEGSAWKPYMDHALKKGWVSKRLPRKLTSSGFDAAAAFLKR